MAKEEAKAVVQYLYHSGFAVKTQNHFLVFDYYPGQKSQRETVPSDGNLASEDLKKEPKAYVFASHGHGDHFHPDIFDWNRENPTIRYIFSSDILKESVHVPQSSCVFLDPYETIKEEGIRISTYGSTDIGVSFFVEVDGLRIFHGGDLNWWHWADESTEAELLEEEAKFKAEVSKFRHESIDIAFFPVDPRLKADYALGGNYFIETFRPKMFFPMHFANKLSITSTFAEQVKVPGVQSMVIRKRGEHFKYNQ